MVPDLINKDMFEPSYNDLKFMVRNNNYFCTNLMTPCSTFCAGTLVKNVFFPRGLVKSQEYFSIACGFKCLAAAWLRILKFGFES